MSTRHDITYTTRSESAAPVAAAITPSRPAAPRTPAAAVPPATPDRGRADTMVLKFGSSVLTHEREVWSAVAEIRREVHRGRRVVAVVSALWGVTDRLLAEARRLTDQPQPSGHAVARLLATGEHQTAALLSLALERSGEPHTVLTARDVGLVALGPVDNADPVTVDAPLIHRELDRAPIVIIPGFEAVDERGRPVLLGRGGSDLTAVFLADLLGADVRLVKDVDGVFEHDPGRPGTPPRRFRTIRWDQVPAVAARLVQTKAVEYAQRRGLNIHVAAVNSSAGTLITDRTELGEAADAERAPAFGRLLSAV
jgi:homoserine dehydrogenase